MWTDFIWHMVGINGGILLTDNAEIAESFFTCFCPFYVPLRHQSLGNAVNCELYSYVERLVVVSETCFSAGWICEVS
jgi:hypothetical protein